MIYWMEDVGIFICWIYLNARTLFCKNNRSYYSIKELRRGRSLGVNPDGRPYIAIGLIAVLSICGIFLAIKHGLGD